MRNEIAVQQLSPLTAQDRPLLVYQAWGNWARRGKEVESTGIAEVGVKKMRCEMRSLLQRILMLRAWMQWQTERGRGCLGNSGREEKPKKGSQQEDQHFIFE